MLIEILIFFTVGTNVNEIARKIWNLPSPSGSNAINGGPLEIRSTVPLTVSVQDGKWGHIEADGKYSGMIGKVALKDYDFIISDIFITYIRVQILDGTVAFDKVNTTAETQVHFK